MEFNSYQSTLEELKVDKEPQEIQDQFFDFINNVPYIRSLISPNRLVTKDIPKDNEGKIIVDITNPHILENMDYFRPSALHFQKTGMQLLLHPK